GDIATRADLNLFEKTVLDRDFRSGPASNCNDRRIQIFRAREVHDERGRLVHRRGVGHAASSTRVEAVDVDGELSDGPAGDEQRERLVSLRMTGLGELIRLQPKAIPAVSGVGVESLLGK